MIKLQHLAIVFVIIIVPISLLLGYYVRTEIDTLKLQIQYDEALITATFDTVKAYEINTSKNPYEIINGSKRRDVEAAINTFFTSFASATGYSGYTQNAIKAYIPAILFTLYDGYFIYAPTNHNVENASGTTISSGVDSLLKPYFTYTQRYRKDSSNDVYITYSLDNYITVTGRVDGKSVNKSGYLINLSETGSQETYLAENILIYNKNTNQYILKYYPYIFLEGSKLYYSSAPLDARGQHWFVYSEGEIIPQSVTDDISPVKDKNAETFYKQAREFSIWVRDHLSNKITIDTLQLSTDVANRNKTGIYGYGTAQKIFDLDNLGTEKSVFEIHRNNMIKLSIKENLSSAMAAYNEHADTKGVFAMPLLDETEWDKIASNLCVVAFAQGLPMGVKTYNNYAIVNNNKNSICLDDDSMVYITVNKDNPGDLYNSLSYSMQDGVMTLTSGSTTNIVPEYHMIDCPYLEANNANKVVVGYRKTEMEQASVEIKEVNNSSGKKVTRYYYKHPNLPCYYCIISKNYNKVAVNGTRLTAKKLSLAREKNIMHNNFYYDYEK